MSYVSIPNGTAGIHNFSDPYYYGQSNTSIGGNLSTVSQNLWNKFLDIFFSSSTNAGKTYYTKADGSTVSLADLLHTSGSWPPAELTEYKDYLLIEGLFSGALKSFFYDYMPNHPGVNFSDPASYVTHFQNFLTDPNRPDIAKKQNSILLWVWEALSLMLESVNKATPTKGNYLLAMTAVEDKTATQIAGIQYLTQQNAEDYSSQATNMNRQKQAEVLRSQRSSAGKKARRLRP